MDKNVIAYCIKIISLLTLFFSFLRGQSKDIEFEHFKFEQGLSSNTILSIIQDSRGFLWIGTYDGLNRYDGYKFAVYKNIEGDTSSLSDNKIRTLYEDQFGDIWIGTWNGLNKFVRNEERFVRFLNNPDDPASLSNNEVRTICEDDQGVLWVGTGGGGLNRFVKDKKQFKHYTHDSLDNSSISSNLITKLFKDSFGKFWIGTIGGGLVKFDTREEQFVSYKHNPGDPLSISNDKVLSVYEDSYGFLWVGTDGGLNKFNRDTEQFTRYENNPNDLFSLSENQVYSIYEDSRRELWIGTLYAGLNKFNRVDEKFIRFLHNPDISESISDNGVMSICEDNSGIIWFGTWEGINKYDRHKEHFETYCKVTDEPNSLSSNGIYAIYEDTEGILWIGTDDGGLNMYDRLNDKFIHFKNDPNNNQSIGSNGVYAICEDSDHNLWIATDFGGLNKFDRKNKKFIRYINNPDDPHSISSNDISTVFLDKSGSLWIGFNEGLDRLNREDNKFYHYKHNPNDPNSISNNLVFTIYEDAYGYLWIGTYGGGLNRYDKEEGNFIRYRNSPDDKSSLSNDFVSVIYEDKRAILWIGTQGGGLNKFNRESETFESFKENDGLPNDVINGILEDNDGNLWISTGNGLSRFNPIQKTFRNFDAEDGLQGNEFNKGACFKGSDGKMFFGGTDGLSAFYPDSIKVNEFLPPVVITDFRLLNKPVSVGYDTLWDRSILEKAISETKEIELNYDDNVISFEFAALDFHIPEKNKYAYMMEGFSEDWTYTDASRRFVTYTNLDPGDYIFKVKASNNDGIWNEEATSLELIINPPWWLTWWAYSIYFIVFVLIVLTARAYDLKRQRLKHQLKLEHEHSEKLQEIDRLKSNFFANISHEFRTPLTLIVGPIEKIISKHLDEDTRKQAGLIKRNANRLLALINQLLDLSKLETGRLIIQATLSNLASFIKGIAMTFESIAENKDITLKVKLEKPVLNVYFDKDMMEKILTNIFSNAFKFTNEGGSIIVTLKETDSNTAQIKIRDTGIGIPGSELPKLFDRFYQVDSSHTREQEGTGIGLALTEELVHLHKGSIKVDSKEGEWTEVTVEIPLGREHLTDEEILEPLETVEEKEGILEEDYPIPAMREEGFVDDIIIDKTIILIVEDNADVREYIKDSISDEYHVVEAVNGEQGVKKAVRYIPDLIISDVMMPKMDGYELTKQIKLDEKTSHIPVILLTAKSSKENIFEGLETGADAYLTKPFEIKELQIRIKNLIEVRKNLQRKFSSKEYLKKPDKPQLSKLDASFMEKLLGIIESHIKEEDFSIDQFGREVGMSRSQIHRKLKALTGKSTSHYIRFIRLTKAKNRIVEEQGNISEIAYSLGFSSPTYFTRCFKEEYGFPPSDLIK